jgi:hypothetical protein
MTMHDSWVIGRARRHKAEAAQAKRGVSAPAEKLPPIDGLWKQLQEETRRKAKVYTDELGDPGALAIETPPDSIELRTPDGRGLTLRLDRERRLLFQTIRDRGGAVRLRKSIIHFSTNAAGELAFNFGGVQGAAGSIIRRIIG